MLKAAIYIDVVLVLIGAIYVIVFLLDCKNRNGLRNLKILAIMFSLYVVGLLYCCGTEVIDFNWDLLILYPILIISLVLIIFCLIMINKKLKIMEDDGITKKLFLRTKLMLVVPILLVFFSYLYELYVLNNCEILLKYNYQDGFIISKDTYLAVVNRKVKNVTLRKNLFKRVSKEMEIKRYNISYIGNNLLITEGFDGEKIEDKNLEKMALVAKEKNGLVSKAYLIVLSGTNYSIMELFLEEETGGVLSGLGEYFCDGVDCEQEIYVSGSLEWVRYFNK